MKAVNSGKSFQVNSERGSELDYQVDPYQLNKTTGKDQCRLAPVSNVIFCS